MKRGLVIGKFYIPHIGHSALIRFALKHCDRLTVLVCDAKSQKISASQRALWLQKIFPNVDVRVIPDIYKDDDSLAWAVHTKAFLGFAPDFVFTGGEVYGEQYARYLNAIHITLPRITSATKVRSNPLMYLQELEPVVRNFFLPRICVLGAESSGTTTLSQMLAVHYGTAWVPEYGEVYSRGKFTSPSPWRQDEFMHIASMQIQMEDQLASSAERLLICDTDPFATTVWYERYMDAQLLELEAIARKRSYALYLVTDVHGVPFVQNGIRDGEHIREWMHNRFVQKLTEWNLPFQVISGSREDRLTKAVSYIDTILESVSSFFTGPSE